VVNLKSRQQKVFHLTANDEIALATKCFIKFANLLN